MTILLIQRPATLFMELTLLRKSMNTIGQFSHLDQRSDPGLERWKWWLEKFFASLETTPDSADIPNLMGVSEFADLEPGNHPFVSSSTLAHFSQFYLDHPRATSCELDFNITADPLYNDPGHGKSPGTVKSETSTHQTR